ncbi:MFS transporter [Tessaracoccus antarcticus]|uniref:MFS transporter n=1 Tax=Tessaracoccus antarcticus TaxID=2479848 RepID=A0A3M0FX25_9ACTN|nr:MFS transporter [Tessaracoccus antarcticus]RMB57045.1 MFS transporter [Tessaracoccus antarcticus]
MSELPVAVDDGSRAVRIRGLAPLYCAGFTTAFGAHSIAAGIGAESSDLGIALLTFGALLAVYDVAEIVLKPLFGSFSDRVGAKPVIVGGLLAFAFLSLPGAFATTPTALGLVRLGQGAAASAFSPASSAAVARIAGPAVAGRYFGAYGSWKALGYILGPLIGAGLILCGGLPALFLTLAAVSSAGALWVFMAMPELPVLPRPQYSIVDVARQVSQRGFLVPTMALAGATGALGVAVGFLPLLGTSLHLPVLASMSVVAVLALASALTQPWVGRLRDAGRISTGLGLAVGLALIAGGVAVLAVVPTPATLYAAAVVLGVGMGVTTPLGFAHLAATTPAQRIGRTMGAADVLREIGDAGGPLLVGGVAAAASLAAGLGTLAGLLACMAVLCAVVLRHPGS